MAAVIRRMILSNIPEGCGSVEHKEKGNPFFHCFYCVIRWFVRLFYPRITLVGTENIPDEPCLLVANHSQMNGPIIGDLYIPEKRSIWCAGEMTRLREVPAYAYQDFWSAKPKHLRWFYKLLSRIIAPIAVGIFNQPHIIPVYKDSRILSTFRRTVSALSDGANVVVFPECDEPYNHIVNRFQDGFVDIARLHRRSSGKALPFVPMYVAPDLKQVHFGAPITYCPDNPKDQERLRICSYLMGEITAMAVSLPPHTVVPYNNIPKNRYPTNISCKEGELHESTCR